MAKAADTVMTLQEVAVYLKIARSTAYKLAQEGKIPGQKVGRHWRFHRAAIDTWLANRTPSSNTDRTRMRRQH